MTDPQSKPETPIGIDSDIEGASLSWTTHPIKKRPLVAVLVSVFILLVSIMVFAITASKWFTALALIVLFGSVAKFYLPTRFRLTEEYVIVKSSTQTIAKRWSDIRSYYVDKNGILLSPFAEPSRLENFRGLYLIANDNKNEIETFIKQRINLPQPKESE